MSKMSDEAERMARFEAALPHGMQRARTLSAPEMAYPLDLPDPLVMIERAKAQIDTLKRDRRFTDPQYEAVWLDLCTASTALHEALDGWPA
jgi:hypothetical protein